MRSDGSQAGDAYPLSAASGRSFLQLVPKDPDWAFAYWEVLAVDVERSLAGLGEFRSQGRLVLRVYEIGSREPVSETEIDRWFGSRLLLLGQPGHPHQAVIGFSGQAGTFSKLCRSPIVDSPRTAPLRGVTPRFLPARGNGGTQSFGLVVVAHQSFEASSTEDQLADVLFPLLDVLEWLDHDHVPGSVTVVITPPLLAMMSAEQVSVLAKYHRGGRIELIPGAGCNGLLTLLGAERTVGAHIRLAVEHFRERFGIQPAGMWLPEAAYRPGLERHLANLGMTYTLVSKEAVELSASGPGASPWFPITSEEGVTFFGCELANHSADRVHSFVDGVAETVTALHSQQGASPFPVHVVRATAQSRGWSQQASFLEAAVREAAAIGVPVTTPREYLKQGPRLRFGLPNSSSLAEDGFFGAWVGHDTVWLLRYLHLAEKRLTRVYRRIGSKRTSKQVARALRQAARELLLASASDWLREAASGLEAGKAIARITDHLRAVHRLADMAGDRSVDEAFLAEREARWAIFPRLDHRVFSAA
jgi:predicted glycosyl hydrolase (DUF1957 family)